MKVEVEIPEGKSCGSCPLVHNTRGTLFHCALIKGRPMVGDMYDVLKKHPDCPSLTTEKIIKELRAEVKILKSGWDRLLGDCPNEDTPPTPKWQCPRCTREIIRCTREIIEEMVGSKIRK